MSIAHDAVAIGVFFPSHAVAVTWFSFFAHVGNIALRFFSSFILYRWLCCKTITSILLTKLTSYPHNFPFFFPESGWRRLAARGAQWSRCPQVESPIINQPLAMHAIQDFLKFLNQVTQVCCQWPNLIFQSRPSQPKNTILRLSNWPVHQNRPSQHKEDTLQDYQPDQCFNRPSQPRKTNLKLVKLISRT